MPTSNARNASSYAGVMVGDGSNHSGDAPSKLSRVVADDKHNEPVPRHSITHCNQKYSS